MSKVTLTLLKENFNKNESLNKVDDTKSTINFRIIVIESTITGCVTTNPLVI